MVKWIDIPPIWLAAHLAALWLLGQDGPQVEGRAWDALGVLLIGLGVALAGWAAIHMAMRRTTFIPHRRPGRLVTDGPFLFTRNPIYLGDTLILLGAVIWSGALLGLILVPLLVFVLTRRFIRPEEARLQARFGAEADTYARRVRRWV